MTLKEKLEELKPSNPIVAIGCKGGSGFLYIGAILEDEINRCFDHYIDLLLETEKTVYKEWKALVIPSVSRKWEEDFSRESLEEDEVRFRDMEKFTDEFVQKCISTCSRYINASKKASHFINSPRELWGREVVETYERELSVETSTVIIIVGDDWGEYWLQCECEKFLNKKDEDGTE